jgi:alkylation response protein AidB-like acyl-CoA dehydrogenase
MISFEPSDDQKLMVESVAQFARTVLRPSFRTFERERALPESVRRTAHELGLGLVALPEAVGGAGLGLTTAVLLEEEVAWGDPAAAFGFGGAGALGLAACELGTAEQARAALDPFLGGEGHARFGAVAWGERKPHPARAGLSTVAKKDGTSYRIDGEKAYVTNADRADRFVVFAQVDETAGWNGVGAFLVDKDAQGLTVLPRETTLGLDVASFGGLRLDGVVVPESARLLGPRGAGPDGGEPDFTRALVRFFAKNALVIAARSVGLARATFEVTREYVDTRKAFGKPIGHFQAVAFTVADRAMDVEAARGLVWRAAAAWDASDAAGGTDTAGGEREALLRTAQAVAFAHEAAMRCGDDGVQLHGGAGFIRDYPVEKWMRDGKQLGLCAMTAEQADQLAAAVELGLPVDPGLVLPTPETQNAFV